MTSHAATYPPLVDRLALLAELRGAADRGELFLLYQPEVEFKTGRIIGAEALIRWQHPRHGIVSPEVFIPLAEETDRIFSIDAWALEEACRQAEALQRFGRRRSPFVISVNFSAREFQQPGVVDRVARALSQTRLSPRALKLEITERSMMPAAAASVQTLRAIKDLGVRLAIDDFGTGYSSLSYLTQFPVDTIKIDQSFVADLNRKPEALAIIRAVTRLARALRMDVTAEGIETPEQRALLTSLRCRRGQGNLFWPALSADDLVDVLESAASR